MEEENNVQEEVKVELGTMEPVVPTATVNNNKNGSSKKGLVIGLIIFILVTAAVLVYILFFNKKGDDNKPKVTPTPPSTEPEVTPVPQNNQNSDGLDNKEYKSKDGIHTLVIINKNNNEELNKVKEKFKSLNGEVYEEVETYGYYDNSPIVITKTVKEDDTYVSIVGHEIPKSDPGMCYDAFNYIYNKQTNQIEYPTYDSKKEESIDWMCVYELSFVKINEKYFFLKVYTEDGDENRDAVIYTNDWNLIGYAKENIESDADGFYYYNSSEHEGEKVKYNTK